MVRPLQPSSEQPDPQAVSVVDSGDIDVTIIGLVVPEELHAKAPQFDCCISARFEGMTTSRRILHVRQRNQHSMKSFTSPPPRSIESVDRFCGTMEFDKGEVPLPPGMDRPTYTVPMSELVEAASQNKSIKLHLNSTEPAPELVIKAEPSTPSHMKSVFGRLMRRDSRGH